MQNPNIVDSSDNEGVEHTDKCVISFIWHHHSASDLETGKLSLPVFVNLVQYTTFYISDNTGIIFKFDISPTLAT